MTKRPTGGANVAGRWNNLAFGSLFSSNSGVKNFNWAFVFKFHLL
jgi:hypothetical protein